MAILQPTCLKHFYVYLDCLEDFREPLIIFSLHSDIVVYNNMVENKEPEEVLHRRAVEIFEEYIIENCRWQLDEAANRRDSSLSVTS